VAIAKLLVQLHRSHSQKNSHFNKNEIGFLKEIGVFANTAA
jgi:hypothetical protein